MIIVVYILTLIILLISGEYDMIDAENLTKNFDEITAEDPENDWFTTGECWSL
jgi:hypothetical protein